MSLRVLIVANHASFKFGGEAALPLHYFRVLLKRNVPVWLLVHSRTKIELESLFPSYCEKIIFIPDTILHRILWKLSYFLPTRLASFSSGFAMRFITQIAQRPIIKRLVRDQNITVIHQPIPVSPKEPSMIFGLGAPVIIGPMNGGIDYPPAFHKLQSPFESLTLHIGRRLANLLNQIIPGKKKAALLLVANERTREALPRCVCNRVETLVENGVDLLLWRNLESLNLENTSPSTITRFVFIGRLVDWKAVDLLLLAFHRAAIQVPMALTIIGDGAERKNLQILAKNLGLLTDNPEVNPDNVTFLGWISQAECAARLRKFDAMILPSLMECGGAVVLEAMAMGIPVIATAWGGPMDYLDNSCGILVEPSSKEGFIENLTSAMVTIAKSPHQRTLMGKAAREKVIRNFDWEIKVDRVLELYREAIR